MTLVDLLEKSLKDKNWDVVHEAYLMIGGNPDKFGPILEVVSGDVSMVQVPNDGKSISGTWDDVSIEKEISKPNKKKKGTTQKQKIQVSQEIEDGDTDDIVDLDYNEGGLGKTGKTKCISRSYEIGPRPNLFVDINPPPPEPMPKDRKKVSRPPPKKYKITCQKCGKVDILDDKLSIPVSLDPTDERPKYFCHRCTIRR